MQTTLSNNQQPDLLHTYLDHASEAAAKCSALIVPLYQYVDEMEQGSTPKATKRLLKLIGIEFKKHQAEMEKYWQNPNRAKELFDQADCQQDKQFEFLTYMKIFKNCDWSQIGDGSATTGIRIFHRLADELCECSSRLYLKACTLRKHESSPIASAA